MSSRTLKPDPDEVLDRLRDAYGKREWKRHGNGVEVLVRTILSQNTNRANSTAGFKQLCRRFDCWSAVTDAPVSEIERCIRVSGLSRIKAPRIRKILRRVREDRGRVTLEFLKRMPPDEAVRYLRAFDGVGAKTASCVMLFAFGAPVFPVDTHIRRIAERLGWVAVGTGADDVEQQLTPRIASDDRYAMHLLLIEHGRRVCLARSPRCAWCDLLELCPLGRQREAGAIEAGGED